MAEKISIELGNVQKTLLLPLWGRAVESNREHPFFVDATAANIIERIDFDFSTMAKNINKLTQFAWIARCINIDTAVSHFLFINPDATIVNIGCGLDTTFDRTDNGLLRWYDLDLPDVIMLRREFIKENERRNSIACSFLDDIWFQQIKYKQKVLFLAAGVFYFFEEKQIREFFIKLANAFPGCELIFDATTPRGLKAANEKVMKEGGMDKSSVLQWGVESSKVIHSWSSKLHIKEEYPIFKKIRRELHLKGKIAAYISDLLKIMYMVHIRFGE